MYWNDKSRIQRVSEGKPFLWKVGPMKRNRPGFQSVTPATWALNNPFTFVAKIPPTRKIGPVFSSTLLWARLDKAELALMVT